MVLLFAGSKETVILPMLPMKKHSILHISDQHIINMYHRRSEGIYGYDEQWPVLLAGGN